MVKKATMVLALLMGNPQPTKTCRRSFPFHSAVFLSVISFYSGLPFGALIQELLGKTLSTDRLS